MGKKLRGRLRERLKKFKRVFGVTLTLDGDLFESPETAWRYVMDNRLLSLLVKKLHKQGFLNSRDYFWVVEWQEETQQAHWHLLLDADFVPYGKLVEVWSSFRPKWAPALPQRVTAENYKSLDRPAFGSVRFTLTKGEQPWKAAAYATKYVIKTPSYGFPEWVLDYTGRIPRYGHSRGFFAEVDKSNRPSGQPVREPSFDPKKLEREPKTLRERIAECKQTTTLLKVKVSEEPGEERQEMTKFRRVYQVPYSDVCSALGVSMEEHRQLRVNCQGVLTVWNLEFDALGSSQSSSEVMEDDW